MKWISVEERLPVGLGDVICYDAYDDMVCAGVYVMHTKHISQGHFQLQPPDFVSFRGRNVTHWMPLPAPPIVKRGAHGEA